MHLLYTQAIGTEVIDETDHQIQGQISDTLLDVDRGTILAFFVDAGESETMILLTEDVISWGQRVHIKEPERLGELHDFIRLEPFMDDDRYFVGQRIWTKNGSSLGRCIDFQFNPDHMHVEWIFPKKFWHRGPALPASDIVEVRKEAIIVKDQVPKEEKVLSENSESTSEVETVVTPARPM